MAAAVITKIVVFDEKMYHGRGDVFRWTDKITNRFGNEARHYAPERTGALIAGIHTSTKQVGVRQVQGLIESRAPHTMYVLRGTSGPIMTDKAWANGPEKAVVWLWKGQGRNRQREPIRQKGYWMPLAEFGGFRRGFAIKVSGQAANNFLLRAWRGTARDHRAIRGPVPSFIRWP